MTTTSRLFVFSAALCGIPCASPADSLSFPNAGFEEGLSSWSADANDRAAGLSQAVPDAARTGKLGLRVTQKETDNGSWLQSARIPVEGGKTYRLEFWARIVETGGIGVWTQFYDESRQPVKSPGGDPAKQISPAVAGWGKQELQFTAPAGSAYFTLAVHGYNKRAVKADFDDFALATADASSVSASAAPATAQPSSNALTPDPARVKEIASYLPAKPQGLGPALDNRAAWDALAKDAETRDKTISRAARFLNEPTPEITPEAYEASVKSGDRKIDNAVSHRRFRLVNFVIAEGVENKGRFIPAIEKEVAAICSETSWILSAHVKFTFGRNDLGTAMTAWNLAAVDTMLGDKLSPGLRKTIRERVRERLLVHYLAEIRGQTKPEWWAVDPNNWNAVVHGGIVGAALALDDSVQERAEIVAAAELGTQFYIKGFPSDGYSPEGMGYWKYGFGHYVLMSEAVFAATKGKVSFYDRDNIRLVAQFPRRFEISPGLYPAYGDAQFIEVPAAWLFHIIDRRYGLGDGSAKVVFPDPTYSAFLYTYGAVLSFDENAAPVSTKGSVIEHGNRPRDWFEQSQIYVGRPAPGADGLGFSCKAGNNGVSHGHNDIGTFVVTGGGQPVLVDPGVPVYNAVTMGPNAFEFQIKSSYGHSVPFVAGQPQKRGAQYAASVKDKRFTDQTDTLVFDISKAYEVPALRELTRRFDFSRQGSGRLVVTDRAVFDTPQAFGTALSTYGDAREEKPGVWIVTCKGRSVRVEISVSGGQTFTVVNEMLKDESREGKVRRLGINLDNPASEAAITLAITPAGS